MSTLTQLPNRIPPSARCTFASAVVAWAFSTIGDDYSRFKQSGILGFESRCLHRRHSQIVSLRPLAARPPPSPSSRQFPPSATITLHFNSLEFWGSSPDLTKLFLSFTIFFPKSLRRHQPSLSPLLPVAITRAAALSSPELARIRPPVVAKPEFDSLEVGFTELESSEP
ncbi:hypothetical protein Droror1_Dr00006257 [Drosera rotundifolia]